ncbi:copper chaperone Copz family protein [Thermus caliditerrae]|uniref:copper chaperone Copz family protein n=1 Tax=Thermus caliditerrae TaxID=1330700 RepID=UPI0005720549|nr:copper chaperone Copz family protein [Thermus caliditerrae]
MLCPKNGKVGLEVPLKTVKNFLTGKALARLDPESPHYLCQDPACPVVYYGQEGVYTLEEVRFPIYDKGASLICYCFDWTREGLAEALSQGLDPVVQVEEGVRAKRCACDQRNPRGRCCLSTLKAEVARLA